MSGLVIIFFEISCPMLSQDFSAVAELLVELLVKNHEFFICHMYLTLLVKVTASVFRRTIGHWRVKN